MGFLATGVVIVIAIILLVSIFGEKGWKATAKQILNAITSENVEDLVYLLPQDLLEYALQKEGMTQSEFIDELERLFSFPDEYSYKLSYEIIGSCPYSESELEDIADKYHDYLDMDKKEIKSATRVVSLISLESRDSDVSTSICPLNLVKIGSVWYIDSSSAFESLFGSNSYWW